MMSNAQISEMAAEIAGRYLADGFVERVFTEAATDSEGREALRVTFVLMEDAVEEISGDEALDLLVGVQNALMERGDERFPIVEYATEKELGPEGELEDMESDQEHRARWPF